MERIMIIGGNASGKTTFSKELADLLNLPLIHIDSMYWTDHWQARPEADFDEMLQREAVKPKWIIDGNNSRTISFRLNYCDTVIYFDFPRFQCLAGAVRRTLTNYGKSRSEMGGYCPEKIHVRFFRDIWNFNKKNQKNYYEMLSHKDNIKVIVLKNHRQVKEFLSQISCSQRE